ncbi:MAG: hypothetical protein HGA45_25225 [Chloroflexales bacterium]|nr:hypothetical protein [Chloroflexales bacterium]
MVRHSVATALAALAVLIGLGLGGVWILREARASARSYVVRVPPGTAARIASGEQIEVFPQRIELKLSQYDTLVIRNDDSEPMTVGPYRIEPGQRFVQHYEGPGTFDMVCSAHGGRRLQIVVTR